MRDMDVAASVIGIRPVYAKLSAFAVSSFIVGVAGAMWGFIHLGAWETGAFDINRSFQLLFMIIIGGLGSIMGSFFGAAFIFILPILLNQVLPGGVTGDVSRAWRHARTDAPAGPAVRAVVLERLSGQVVMTTFDGSRSVRMFSKRRNQTSLFTLSRCGLPDPQRVRLASGTPSGARRLWKQVTKLTGIFGSGWSIAPRRRCQR